MTVTQHSSVNATQFNGKHAVELENTHIYYGSFRAVKDVSLQIERQKITASLDRRDAGRVPFCAPSTV